MRIAINLLYLIPGVVGGTETYARGLIGGLEELGCHHEFVVFVNRAGANWHLPAGAQFQRIVCPVRGTRRVGRYLYEQVRLPSLLKAHRVDIVHSLGYVAPLVPGCRSVVTIPDTHFLAYGERNSIVRRLILAALVYVSASRADHILTISEFSRREVCDKVGVSPSRVTVTHLAPENRWMEGGTRDFTKECDSGYAVAFSSAAPNKNIRCLITAYGLARSRGLRQRLVIVGHLPPNVDTSLADGVERSGYLDDNRLREAVAGADFLIFPSVYEGFGLPVLEAMAAGVPVLCSNRGSLPEVAGQAAVFFDPESIEGMADGMRTVGGDPELRRQLRASGFENARRFSWKRTASETLAVYEQVMQRGARGG